MEDERRRGAWRFVALVAVLAALVLGALAVSCDPVDSAQGGSTPRARADGGPSAADVAALAAPRTADPGTSTTDAATTPSAGADAPAGGPPVPAPGSDPGDGGGAAGDGSIPGVLPASSADCAALEQIVIPAARIITEADFVPVEDRPPAVASGDRSAALERVAAVVPVAQRAAWQAVAATVARAQAEGRGPTETEQEQFRAARNASEVWARAACPTSPPSWRCDDFGSVGPGPDVAPAKAEAATPEDALHRDPDTGRAVELERTADIVLYGWVTEAGFVTRTLQVERVGDGWATARRHTCHGA